MPSQIVADIGGVNSNSYLTLDDADALADDLLDDGGWSTLDDDTKTRLLFEATKAIDKLKIVYDKKTATQNRKFPVSAYDENGIAIDGMDEVKEACLIQAIYYNKYANQIDYAARASITGITGESYSAETRVSRNPTYNPWKKFAPGTISVLSYFIDLSLTLSRG